ncbi:MAG TPA: arsenic resistance N-acetyltransferase ArsN2 [Vicinamibacterales bacterium]|nr:arsenic resistance N-acetyltransferase ArsN2 [Vicinamibacterales bacterium]
MTTGITPAQPEDLAAISRLLSADDLPLEGLADHLATTLVARSQGHVVGAAGLEVYAEGGLLRSVVIDRGFRGTGLGRQLVEAVTGLARARGLPALYLLTTTAAAYFPKLGFVVIARDEIPMGVQQSVEFTSACPASASALMKRLWAQTGPRRVRW